MATIDNFTTAEEGWGLVGHFLGNILLVVRMAVSDKQDGWESVVAQNKLKLAERLKRIAQRMADNGYLDDSAKINDILRMVEEGDLTDSAIIDAIHAENLEYNVGAQAIEAKVRELFNKDR